jgi:GDP-L-fucose synthase
VLNSKFSIAGKRVYVAGHRGMVGQALIRRLADESCEVITADREKLDLRNQQMVENWMSSNRPDVVLLAAARVGGILANSTEPATFIYDNLIIATNVIEASRRAEVAKLVFLGSSCIYPKFARQPIPETSLLTGSLEPTNEWYAIAKIAGIKLVQAYRRQHGCDFVSAQPTNLYGPFDNFDYATSHVLPALLRKAHDSKRSGAAVVEVWGSGQPLREFLHVDDLADAIIFLVQNYSGEEIVNVGSGQELSIADLAKLICSVTDFQGALQFDATKPDGTPRKLLDSSRLNDLGWRHKIELREGLKQTYEWFQKFYAPTE